LFLNKNNVFFFKLIKKYLLEQLIIHFVLFVVYYEDFLLIDNVFLLNVHPEFDVVHFLHYQTRILFKSKSYYIQDEYKKKGNKRRKQGNC